MSLIIFPSKLTSESPRYAFNFLEFMRPSDTIYSSWVGISVFSGTDDGNMGSMIEQDSLSTSSSIVTVNVGAGTAGVIYELTATVQLNDADGPVYQRLGKVAVLPGTVTVPPVDPIVVSMVLFEGSSTSVSIDNWFLADAIFDITISGGTPPYSLEFTLEDQSAAVFSYDVEFDDPMVGVARAFVYFSSNPGTGSHTCTLALTVTDAASGIGTASGPVELDVFSD